jgi:hypothetical protein
MKRRDAIKQGLDQVTARIARTDFIPGYRLIEQAMADSERPIAGTNKFSNAFGLFIAATCLILATVFFVTRLLEFGDWPPTIYSTPEVFNLTKEKVKWDVHYGASIGCESDECYRQESTPSSFFRRHEVLPMREFPLKNWSKNQPIFYRATIKLPEHLIKSATTEPLSLHTILMFAKSWDLFLNNNLVFQGTQETMLAPIPLSFLKPDGTITLAIRAFPGDLPYQGISNRGDLVIGPRSKLAGLAHFARDNQTSLQLLYLLPKLSFCVVFAMLFMFVRRNQEIMWFLLFGLTSSIELFMRSEYSSGLGLDGQFKELLALMARNYSLILLARFIYAFFRLELKRANLLMTVALAAMTLFNLLSLTVMNYKTATTSLDVVAIIIKPCVYIFSVIVAVSMAGLLSKSEKSIMRSRVALAFSGILIFGCCLAFIDLAQLVVDTLNLSISIKIVNLTWVFDLILFIFMASVTGIEMAVQHAQQKSLKNQLQNLDDRLELAQSVQSTLLPTQMAGTRGNASWDCKYISAERLAGDWLFLSDGRHHKTRFFLGDVTGKGPAAALAVAAIVSLLRKKDFEPTPLDSTIKELNIHIFNLFRGNIGSAVCAAQMDDNGIMSIAVHGMAGWVHVSKAGAKLIPARGHSLGTLDHIDVQLTTFQLDVGDFIFAFSDGCIEGTRPIARLIRHLTTNQNPHITADELFKTINEIGKDSVHADDKAMIYVRRIA